MKTIGLLRAQTRALAMLTTEIHQYVEEVGIDGLDYNELEAIDSMVNTLIHHSRSVLGTIGPDLKAERKERAAHEG